MNLAGYKRKIWMPMAWSAVSVTPRWVLLAVDGKALAATLKPAKDCAKVCAFLLQMQSSNIKKPMMEQERHMKVA